MEEDIKKKKESSAFVCINFKVKDIEKQIETKKEAINNLEISGMLPEDEEREKRRNY